MKIVKNIFFTLVLFGFLTPFLILGYFLLGQSYDIEELIEYNPQVTTRIYDKNGEKIANIFEEEHRYYATFNEIPPRAIEALLAIEDTTFFEHPGINMDAIFRAIVKDIQAGKLVEGASTITQQLVKNRLLSREKKLSRKVKELIYSLKVERYLTKEQILERYLNEIYLGHGYYGIKTAADGYFHKQLSELTLKEIAILVGLPKAPSTYAPTKNYEISMGRANRVISRMYALGWIDEQTHNSSLLEKPKVFDDTLTQNNAPFIVDEVARRVADLGISDMKSGGYEIYTTIDMRLQEAAKDSLKKAYDMSVERAANYRDANTTLLNGALVSLDSKTGDILALVGSVDYKKSSYNRATQGRRQPGSAFKPFIYQVAIDLGYSGATELVDMARTYTYEKDGEEQKWQPKNYEEDYEGLMTLREALVHSRNLATINLVSDIGLTQILKEFKKFGIENLPPNLSLALGTISLSPLQLAKYYTSFANSGVQVEPNLIRYIDKKATTVYEKKEQTRYITKDTQAYIMTAILKDVVERGTGKQAKVKGIELAGKTGTTNNNIDGWFAGYSPTIETVVWFGNDDNSPMHKLETGGRVAAPAFSMYYENVLRLYPQIQRTFEAPAGIMEVVINGKKEYFSDISKPPRAETEINAQEKLLF
ncbi:MAG: penicillin-binding protein [Sulfurimonas sp. RIFOXYD12_FULL_33_39]|uniref:penicillin-binding protein 1A n=1 Tax=unclassified Sulfurimonas TaxID=2623549 RepID=UPI0008C2E703|nr:MULTISPECIES: PBP1A family penicillin-binding protein [unclassified Sulfurimonas]OHE09768.1 MAG: penicillin-binding protein [Sulfurimonas sp. RIFOXYD12_FULL_33_39]OHE13724.1 MAG: penicillin-binding protein [Sulfurimonas sp. RIFOXYD2_FULL_34_21]DAB28060.1 MAG TPA: penicillin-binding protein [Sulfurimonas sp. UBA10385]